MKSPGPARRSKPRAQTLAERLLGGWRLTEMRLEGVDSRGRIAQGFLHIGPAFLSMELHAAWDASQVLGAIPDSDVHAAFTAEYVIDGAGVLDCSTVIGSFVDEASGLLQWERPAFKRRYLIRENGRQLMLQFGEKGKFSNQLVFEPYLPTARGTRDIFGRPTAGVESGETDIFGRRRPDAGGERDIYGREKPGEPAAPEATAGEGAPGSGNNK